MPRHHAERENRICQNINLGDHLCSIYSTKEQQFSAIASFFKEGLDNNQKCIYIADENSKEEVLLELAKRGIGVGTFIASRQLLVLGKHETYLKNGAFEPSAMIRLLRETEQAGISEGYSGVRITGEMTCLCENTVAHDRLIEYESSLNDFFPQSKVAAICQYNESKFSPETLKEVLHTHPLVIIYDKNPRENMYYSPQPHIDKGHSLPSGSYATIRDDILSEE
jgi:hypothetical protein